MDVNTMTTSYRTPGQIFWDTSTDSIAITASNNPLASINGSISNGVWDDFHATNTVIHFPEDSTIKFGEDLSVSVKEFKACFKVLREIARERNPEDFI